MHVSSSRADTTSAPEEINEPRFSSVTLSERSLLLVSLVRIFVGLLWFQQLAWKMPPTFGGLRRYVESEAQHTFLPGYSFVLNNVFLAHFSLLGAGVWILDSAQTHPAICLWDVVLAGHQPALRAGSRKSLRAVSEAGGRT